MGIDIEIRFDLSNFNDKNVSGECIIARKGNIIKLDRNILNNQLNNFIRKECQDGLNDVSFITFYFNNNSLIVLKKFTNLKKRQIGMTMACSQVIISIPEEYNYSQVLSSKEIQEILFSNNYDQYINYFFINKQEYKLFEKTDNFIGDINELIYTDKTYIYSAQSSINTFICDNKDIKYLFYKLFSKNKNKNKISLLSLDIEKNIQKIEKLKSILYLKKIEISENKRIAKKIEFSKDLSMKNNKDIISLNSNELERILKYLMHSIELDLNTIKILTQQESSFFSRKRIDNDKINEIIKDSINYIKHNRTLTDLIIKELYKKLENKGLK